MGLGADEGTLALMTVVSVSRFVERVACQVASKLMSCHIPMQTAGSMLTTCST